MTTPAFRVPPSWGGRTVVVIGGGRSLSGIDLAPWRGVGPCIAINRAAEIAPWAAVVLGVDPRVFATVPRLLDHAGLRVTRAPVGDDVAPQLDAAIASGSLRVIGRGDADSTLSTDPARLAGKDFGSAAINYAYLAGARRIVLLGFDMRSGRWHDGYPASGEGNYDVFLASAESMIRDLRRRGGEVCHGGGSRLSSVPTRPVEEIAAQAAADARWAIESYDRGRLDVPPGAADAR